MNNAVRGVILAIALLGMGLMFLIMVSSLDDGSGSDFDLENLANALTAGLGMLSCAVIGGGALSGMTPSQAPPATVQYPHQWQQAAAPQFPQPGVAQQQYAPQQYGAQPQQPRQD